MRYPVFQTVSYPVSKDEGHEHPTRVPDEGLGA